MRGLDLDFIHYIWGQIFLSKCSPLCFSKMRQPATVWRASYWHRYASPVAEAPQPLSTSVQTICVAPISAALFRHWFFALVGLMATQKPPGQECTVPRWVQFFTLYSLAGLIFFAAGLAAQAVRESTHRSKSSFFIKTLLVG